MKILHTSDWHLGKNLERESRLEEQELFLEFFINTCNEIKPDLILIAGDIYDTPNPPARAEKLFYDCLKKLSRGGECVTLVIAGNHDNPERLVAAWPIAMEHGIVMLGTPKSVVQVGSYGKQQVIDAGQGFVELQINDERVIVLAVPYPSEKRLNEMIYHEDQDEVERMHSYGEKMGSLFSELEKHFREDTINITTSHLFAFGAEKAGSERAITLGDSFLVGADLLPKTAQYTALGHIHKPQILPGTAGKVRYSGSPIHYDRSEPSGPKKLFVVDVKAGEEASISELDIPIFKPIQVWKANSVEDAIQICKDHGEENSWVYLEIKVKEFIKEYEIKEMKSLKKDILEIIPVFESTEVERDKERINQMSFEEQFVEFYKSKKDMEPSQELMDLFKSILSQEDQDETN